MESKLSTAEEHLSSNGSSLESALAEVKEVRWDFSAACLSFHF